jgi:hypothetical protein
LSKLEATKVFFSEWVGKLTGLFSDEKKWAIKSQKKTWKTFNSILLSESSQSEKVKYCTIQLSDILEIAKLWRK